MYDVMRGRAAALLWCAALLTGCATTGEHSPGDPMEPTNRKFHELNDALDRTFMAPLARGYRSITPRPLRQGITNFFDNLSYLNVIANDLLQGKGGQFVQDSGRFVVNSTVGVGGLFDPATKLGLRMNEEDLGQTLGVWGAGEGAYLVTPFFGPSSLRDAPDYASAYLLNPLTWLNSGVVLPLTALNLVNNRANLLEATDIAAEAAIDPYTYIREAYRQRREYLIYDGNPPLEDFEDFEDEEP